MGLKYHRFVTKCARQSPGPELQHLEAALRDLGAPPERGLPSWQAGLGCVGHLVVWGDTRSSQHHTTVSVMALKCIMKRGPKFIRMGTLGASPKPTKRSKERKHFQVILKEQVSKESVLDWA